MAQNNIIEKPQEESVPMVDLTRYASLPKSIRILFIALVSLGIITALYYMFHWRFFGTLFDTAYYYLLIALFGPLVFLVMPARKKDRKIPWYDLVAAALIMGFGFFAFFHTYEISQFSIGWVTMLSTRNFAIGLIAIILLLEAARRIGGLPYFLTCLLIGIYPLFAGYLPGVLYGIQSSLSNIVGNYIYGWAGVVGLPAAVLGQIIIGFLVFAGVLLATGAGDFFIKLAFALMGQFRGGPAKVAVVASGFFGSISGSVIANVAGTGSITIPAMKKLGYPPHYAGAIEACASTGGIIMPPVMGTVAFIMAEILNIEYAVIIVAAFVPAALYYFGLLMQVDAYAARVGLRGLSKQEIPSLKQTLKEGWIFLFVLLFLVWGLLYMRWSTITPYYAAALMIVLTFTNKKTMLTPRRFVNVIVTVGILIVQLTGLILTLGIILGGLQLTGMVGALTAWIVALGGTNIWLCLFIGIVVCYLFGTMGMSIPAYVILSVTMAPVVVQVGGLNVLAVHLFIIYYAMLSAITPPVALGAFIGASIAGAQPMRTAWVAMRLGVVIYFIPLFFVFNPSLILAGSSILNDLYFIALAIVGIGILAGGMEGYLLRVGILRIWERPLLVIAGFLIAYPETLTSIVGAILAVAMIAEARITRRRQGIKQPVDNIPLTNL